MKTFLADIIPKIQRYSEKLDNMTLLVNQHWVVMDEIQNSKCVYIFRQNNDLLISNNGRVEKAKWEYIGNNSILIERKDEAFLLRHGFFDENVLALKIDGKDGYAFLVNESRFSKEINGIDEIIDFLDIKYNHLNQSYRPNQVKSSTKSIPKKFQSGNDQLTIYVKEVNKIPHYNDKVCLDNKPAPDGKYKIGFMWFSPRKIGQNEFEISKVHIFAYIFASARNDQRRPLS